MRRIIQRRAPRCDPAGLPAELHPLLRRIYAARGLEDPAQLELSLERLIPPQRLGGVKRAVDLLQQALIEQQRLLIVGDFDADGATSTALCMRALRSMGLAQIDYLVPNRFDFGYGLTPELVEVAAGRGPDLILTVDNGVSSIEGVAAARALGIRVLVTDHHLPGERLPAADALVNPNLPGDDFPSKHLAGVGVAFYLMLALRARLRDSGWFSAAGIAEPNLAALLDLVALGTVADVVPLDHNNRILVEQGLRRIRAGRCVPGIRALLEVARRSPVALQASDLGFAVGPRLNAAGRLEDMALGIECLLCDDPDAARGMAAELDALNRERREIEAGMKAEALAELERVQRQAPETLPTGVCLYRPEWHQGVIGILAARVREAWHRPVIAFARSGTGELKGSARSVPGLHIRDALEAVAAREPGLIPRFGGHAMAAGLSLREADLETFRTAFDAEVRRHLGPDDLRGVIHSDGELAPDALNMETAELLRGAGPWGQAFPEPVFDGVFELRSWRLLKDAHLKLQLRPRGGSVTLDAIAFNQADAIEPREGMRLEIAYRLDINDYRGLRSLQLMVEYLREGPAA
ncbi:single-stranded-DNA-specific exonuclease RecJ [Thiohalobacter sp. IOR34]|uniref:single-stranded-DNA-specific exonuclease RecJ n=1 Tax=Thiohalobacter sp. IOR34 TaxID=3057176 RepID=UPI0025B07B6A|nr:single-stranded-DNA-specific exonuclease RecJ [Thiohalobacter sp. IOR34]WJW74409.1 single-stranded-DNA-specific exonuclease RecJ [Thiohalobacter sp. IOR34]